MADPASAPPGPARRGRRTRAVRRRVGAGRRGHARALRPGQQRANGALTLRRRRTDDVLAAWFGSPAHRERRTMNSSVVQAPVLRPGRL
ncbi:hypothetical protein NOCARDAX2BIS_230212 [Nocardioides sp. AX2bis]|nr:hypothetical protein NOCARDAX2BIS_230212 [Nocardioides sp. AX2bis]